MERETKRLRGAESDVPIDVLSIVFAWLDFETFFFVVKHVCRKWHRCFHRMLDNPAEAFKANALSFLRDISLRRNKHSLENVWLSYCHRTEAVVPFALCACGGCLVKTTCNHCTMVRCRCIKRNTEHFTCINAYCLMKRQFAVTFNLCLCRFPEICAKTARHLSLIFPK